MSGNGRNNLADMEEKVFHFVEENQLLIPGDRILAGVSGGADSVCLLFVLLALKEFFSGRLYIEVVHVHHMIRGEEADEDMAYVERLCRQYKVPFHPVKKPVEQIATEHGWTVEEAGRRVRYEVFETICRERNLNKIAVAHHRDDNAETILMNLFRGSGMKGVSGIPAVRDSIVRPLLNVSRNEIEAYLKERDAEYRTDSTNRDCNYTRNKVRNELLPYIQEHINTKVTEHLVQFGVLAGEIDAYFQKKANILFEKYGRVEQNRAILCLECLKEDKLEVTYLIRKILSCVASGLQNIGQDHLEQIYKLMNGRTGGKCRLPGGICVEKSYDRCMFFFQSTPKVPSNGIDENDRKAGSSGCTRTEFFSVDCNHLQENQPFTVCLEGAKFTFTVKKLKKNETFPKKKYTKWFDCGKIKFTLQLRTRKNGDFIVINSEGGRKKLKDYFIDQKIAREDRDGIFLLAEGQEILWITGMRISERYKIDENTTRILEVCME